MQASKPLVLCFSGHDPGGGAGIHADIEAIAAQGGHALTVITAHTVQDSVDVRRVSPVAPIFMAAQTEALLADCRVAAIKIGLLGDAAQIPHILEAIERCRVPVVLDPVLRAGGGTALASAALVEALRTQLIPRVSVLTPNAAEARRLAPGAQSLDDCAQQLRRLGAGGVLITGGDEPGDEVCNHWHGADGARDYRWPRIPAQFHGAGCTLAATLAARLALGDALATALQRAQRDTHAALAAAYAVGQGRLIPRRIAGGA